MLLNHRHPEMNLPKYSSFVRLVFFDLLHFLEPTSSKEDRTVIDIIFTVELDVIFGYVWCSRGFSLLINLIRSFWIRGMYSKTSKKRVPASWSTCTIRIKLRSNSNLYFVLIHHSALSKVKLLFLFLLFRKVEGYADNDYTLRKVISDTEYLFAENHLEVLAGCTEVIVANILF